MDNIYYEGQIFIETIPDGAISWCNEGQKYHIEPYGNDLNTGKKTYIIKRNNNTETKEIKIKKLQDYLDETDWYCSRFVDTGVPIPDDIKIKRQQAREELEILRR